MTREEAMKIMRESRTGASPEENWLNAFVALGILKLDEPKSIEERIEAAFHALGPNANAVDIQYYCDIAGIKIVEK